MQTFINVKTLPTSKGLSQQNISRPKKAQHCDNGPDKIIRIFLLKMSFGSVRSLVGISFHSFAPITEKDFRLTSRFDFFNIKVVGNWRSRINYIHCSLCSSFSQSLTLLNQHKTWADTTNLFLFLFSWNLAPRLHVRFFIFQPAFSPQHMAFQRYSQSPRST